MRLRLERRPSALAPMLLISDDAGALRALEFADYEARLHRLLRQQYGAYHLEKGAAPKAIGRAFDDYFAGHFDALAEVPVVTGGTRFQRTVWRALRAIPAGQTVSYGALAASLGQAGAARAVGRANGSNPVAIVVPCHRVIGATGALTGYGGGLSRKRWLLDHELRHATAGT